MTDREIMQMALDALYSAPLDHNSIKSRFFERRHHAIIALRERLAQPEQEPVLQDIEQYRMQMASISTAAIGYWKEGDGIHPDYDTPALRDVADLYAKYELLVARPKSEWRWLTENEMKKLADTHLKYQPESYEVSGVFDLIRAVEAKLKEKND